MAYIGGCCDLFFFFFFQAEDGIRDRTVTGVQTCALPISRSIKEILDLLLTFARVPIQLREDPARLRPIDVPLLEADTSHLRTDTNWKPVEIGRASCRERV